MFRTLIYPSSGACDCAVELPHRSFCSWFVVCWRFGAASACNTDTTQTHPHQISNTHRTENKTTNLVIQQHSRKLLMMDILMSETCWAHKKFNKTASDIKFVFYSSTITVMHGPVYIRCMIMCIKCKVGWFSARKRVGLKMHENNIFKINETTPTCFDSYTYIYICIS